MTRLGKPGMAVPDGFQGPLMISFLWLVLLVDQDMHRHKCHNNH